MSPKLILKLNDGFINDIQFKKIIKEIYYTGSDSFIEWQENFRKCVDFVYNLNGNKELKDEENKFAKFVAYTIRDNEFYTYSQDIEIITDNYINIHNYHRNKNITELIKGINNKDSNLELHNVYTSTKLTSMFFAILDQVVRHENLQIKTCLNCVRYFIPNYRQFEEIIEYVELTAKGYCKCVKWENIRALLWLAVVNNRLTEQQAEFLEKEYCTEWDITKILNLYYENKIYWIILPFVIKYK